MTTKTDLLPQGLPGWLGEIKTAVKTLQQQIGDPSVVGVYPTTGMAVGDIEISGTPMGGSTLSAVSNVIVNSGAYLNSIYADLSWVTPPGVVSHYIIACSEQNSDGTFAFPISTSTNLTSWRILGLKPNTSYGIKIWAIDALGRAGLPYPMAGQLTFTTSHDDTIPATPTGVSASSGVTSAVVTWNDNTEPDVALGAGLYEVQSDTNPSFGSSNSKIQRISGTIMTFAGLTAGVLWYFRVRAIDSSGNTGPWSVVVNTTPGSASSNGAGSDGLVPPVPSAPSTLLGMVGALFIKWTAVANNDATTYDVYVGTTSNFSADAAHFAVSTPATSAVLKDINGTPLSSGTNYYIRLVARDRDGSSNPGPVAGPVAMVAVTATDVNFTASSIGGITTYVQPAMPTNANNGSIWIDTGNGNAIKQLTGGVWGTYQFTDGAISTLSGAKITAGTITAAQLAAGSVVAGKIAANSITASQIAAGTITATQIAAGTITSASGVVGALDAGSITTGTLQSNVIGAGSITASKLTVSGMGPNLIPNGTLSDITPAGLIDSWTNTGNGGFNWVSDATAAGSPTGMRFASAVNPADTTHRAILKSSLFSVQPGKVLPISFAFKSTITNPAFGAVLNFVKNDGSTASSVAAVTNAYAPIIQANDASGIQNTLVDYSGSFGYMQLALNPTLGVAGLWYRVRAAVNVPADAAYAYLTFTSDAKPSNPSTESIADVTANVQLDGAAIIAGTITSDRISTVGLDAGVIKFGTMSGSRISVGSLDASTLKTSTLTAATISIGSGGHLLVGSAGVNGIQLDANGLFAWSAGVPTLQISSTGSVSVTGSVSASVISGSMIYGTTYFSVPAANVSTTTHLEIANTDSVSVKWKYGPLDMPAPYNQSLFVGPSVGVAVGGSTGSGVWFPGTYEITGPWMQNFYVDSNNNNIPMIHNAPSIWLDGNNQITMNGSQLMCVMDSSDPHSSPSIFLTTGQWTGSRAAGNWNCNLSQGNKMSFTVENVSTYELFGDSFFFEPNDGGAIANFVVASKVSAFGFIADSTTTGNWLVQDQFGCGMKSFTGSSQLPFYIHNNLVAYFDGTGVHNVSSVRNKEFIADWHVQPDMVDRMRTVTYHPLGERRDVRAFGVIAEEMLKHDDLRQFLGYDQDGQPDSVVYDRLAVAMAVAVNKRVRQLEDKINSITKGDH